MATYSIISSDQQWSYNYDDEVCEKHKNLGRNPYQFKDLDTALKCLKELEDEDFSVIDNATGKKVSKAKPDQE